MNIYMKQNINIPHGRGQMEYRLKDGTYAEYLGNWEYGEKNDEAGRYIVNVLHHDWEYQSPMYFLEGKWKDNEKEGFHDLYVIKDYSFSADAYRPLDRRTKKTKPQRQIYFEHNKPADKKIEDTIQKTLDDKNVPDELIRKIKSYK